MAADDETPSAEESSSPWKLTALAVLALVGLGLFGAVFSIYARGTSLNVDATLKLAIDEYNAGRWDVAQAIADSLSESPDWTDSRRRMHAFLGAASRARVALGQEDTVQRRLQLRENLDALDLAKSLGFPDGYAQEGLLLLGRSRYLTGDFTGAAAAYELGVQNRIADQRRYLPQMADAQLRSSEHPADVALETIDRFLNLPTVGPQERAHAQMLRSRILVEQRSWEEARQSNAKAATEDALRLACQLQRARIDLAQARSMRTKPADDSRSFDLPPRARKLTNDAFESLIEISRISDEVLPLDATLVAGQAKRILGEYDKALALFSVVRQNRVDMAVSIAAGLEELEILVDRAPAKECTDAAAHLARDLGDPIDLDPRLLALDELRERLKSVVQRMQRRSEFAAAIELARAISPAFPPADALRMEATSYAAWADAVRANAMVAVGDVDPVEIGRSRQLHALAGEAFERAAGLRLTSRQYPEFLWDAIQQYDKADLYRPCLDLLEPYLRYEQREQVPRALILQGKAYMAMQDYSSAVRVLEASIAEFPRDSLKYRARMLAAQAAAAMGDSTKAVALLDENLYDGLLAPSSQVWQESLFTLGELLCSEAIMTHYALVTPTPNRAMSTIIDTTDKFRENQKVFESAIQRLKEVQTRFSGQPQTRRSEYLLAQAHRYAAQWPAREAEMPETLDTGRRALRRQHSEHLTAAARTYRTLRDKLNSAHDDKVLTAQEQLMLRNCYLGEADALMELGRYDEAIASYSATINRFINEPLALEAMIQQSKCYETLGRKDDADRVLRQARQILDRIPADYDGRFAQTTRFDRAQWAAFFDWLLQS